MKEAKAMKVSPLRAERRADGVIALRGHLSGGAEETLAAAVRGEDCVFDMSDVTVVNSAGIRDWMAFVMGQSGRRIVVEKCPPHLVLTFNMITNFLRGVAVRSVLGAFSCSGCRTEEVRVIDLKQDVDGEGNLLRCEACAKCGGELAPVFPDDYFAFLAVLGGE